MAFLARSSFLPLWCPDVDAVAAPPDALLRADNLIIDELGIVSLRRGSDVVYTLSGQTDVHSLFTAVLGGTRYRFAGAGDTVYLNGSSLSTSVAGSDDISFGSMMGQVFFARSTTKKKYDGTTLRNWGIAMTGGTPTVTNLAADSKTFATGNSTESPAFSYIEDDGTGATFTTGYEGTANGAIRLHVDTVTDPGNGTIRKTFAADTNFSIFDAGGAVDDNDIISLWCWIEDVSILALPVNGYVPKGRIALYIATNVDLGVENDYFYYPWDTSNTTLVNGWNYLTVRRGDMFHQNATGTSWNTTRIVQLYVEVATGHALEVRFDSLQVRGGALQTGAVTWKYRLAYNNGTYTTLSPTSAASAFGALTTGGATVTVPADASRDTQFNEIWLYRNEPELGTDYYRVKVKTGVSGTGAITIDDTLSAADALTVDIVLDDTDTTPPSTILMMAAPHFDRLWALTATMLYPSKKLNPDTFATGQAITIGGADEVGYWVVKAPGGLYLGTSKDIYRINGTGAELPDGTIDVTKEPMHVDHPPIGAGIATEGPSLVYISSDGWRTLDGYKSTALSGLTSLLYQGYTRHGVSPVNVTGGRFRAALGKDQLFAITPEGTSTTNSAILYRHRFKSDQWYRHPYGVAWRSLFREPDGTLLAGDTTGQVWSLDSNSTATDNGTAIDVTLWTKADDLGDPFRQKVVNDLHLHVNTGDTAMTAAVHLDQSGSASATFSDIDTATVAHTVRNLLSLATARQVQLRLTGSVTAFSLGAVGWSYKAVPLGVMAWDSGPITGSADLLWARGVVIQCIGSAVLTVKVYADGALAYTQTVTPESATAASPVTAWLGRGVKGASLRVTIESTALFMPYWIEILRRETGNSYERGAIRVKAEVAA